MKKDTAEFVRRCDKCQRFSFYTKSHPETLNSMISPWQFTVWGINIIGALPTVKGNVKYAVVVVDYFTKWVEAEPMAAITSKKMQSFVWRFIICRYGIPQKLVSDNRKQFDSDEFKNFCNEIGIVKSFSIVVHPQSNGQVEVANKTLKHNLKANLEVTKEHGLKSYLMLCGHIAQQRGPILEKLPSLWPSV